MIFFDVSFENEKLAENYKQLMRELGTLKLTYYDKEKNQTPNRYRALCQQCIVMHQSSEQRGRFHSSVRVR